MNTNIHSFKSKDANIHICITYCLLLFTIILGYAVYAIDHYAHGKSDGVKGIITDYHVLYNDFIEFSEYVQSKHTLSLLPVYLFRFNIL